MSRVRCNVLTVPGHIAIFKNELYVEIKLLKDRRWLGIIQKHSLSHNNDYSYVNVNISNIDGKFFIDIPSSVPFLNSCICLNANEFEENRTYNFII